MNCPVCNKSLAPTLSICPSCGAMMNDSVREELMEKLVTASRPLRMEARPNPPLERSEPVIKSMVAAAPAMPQTPSQPTAAPVPAPVRTHTTEIMPKQTSPTLVEFQNKNATVPDWRLQLQNAVRKRVDNVQSINVATTDVAEVRPVMSLPTNGGAALKAQVVEAAEPAVKSSPALEKALKRIEQSRQRFLSEETARAVESRPATTTTPAAPKSFPFYIATKNAELMPKPVETRVAAPVSIVEELPILEKKPFDTNKLKPLPKADVIASSIDKLSGELPALETATEKPAPRMIARVGFADNSDDEFYEELNEAGDVIEGSEDEDFAPLGMRFNAGVFDLVIGGFTALILLSPFMITGGRWFSVSGMLAFAVTTTLVMFIYLTSAIGLFGKTIGMKILALETIDIEENDYPSFHQAAVSSSVYLVSLALGGIGFIPALFNPERRTAPDLLSGTMIVREG